MIIALQTLVFFRESLVEALRRLISPYYLKLRARLTDFVDDSEEEDDEEVFAEFDEEKGVVFFPPMYIQRYASVSDCLLDERWNGKLEKIVDLGYHDMTFIKYLKDVPGVRCILGVDIESIPLKCSSDLLGCEDYAPKRENPLQVTLFQGNAADPDYRLIGCDAVVAIEMIEHMLPHDLDRLVHTIFGFIKPWIAVITTPNGDFNALFKAMEKNGLRRCDHFFEWSREQFHDWCSNIVMRYPQFTVQCQGIGPGPPGTSHYGCCSQLALFVNKCYVKQQDLDLKSLEVVPKIPAPDVVTETSGFETPIEDPGRMICPQKQSSESLTNLLYSRDSYLTIMIASSTSVPLSLPSVCRDQTSQCNLDTESGKNFLFKFNDDDMWLSVLCPRRKSYGRVYQIEDVNSRLNCTTFQVTKFSKTTQNLMAKNKIDSLAHTREVVGEIRHLTNMLNWKQDMVVEKRNGHIWCNINWGDNAPYWNQYYQIVREYNYPFEVKSDESRILDLISEEINRIIDGYNKDTVNSDLNKLQIPLENLMKIVYHITSDVDMVKDLLEWNGYEIDGDQVIYSRLAVDAASFASSDVDWPENDTSSELDTVDVQSTTVTETSTAPDYHGRLIRRVLDKKVRGLREMLCADEDITTELDKIVCRLMKLALRTSKGRSTPPPAKWMQCKLLDLLTLTEKAISRRNRHTLDILPMKASDFTGTTSEMIALLKINTDNVGARNLVYKYRNLLEDVDSCHFCDPLDFGFEDDLGEPTCMDTRRDILNERNESLLFADNDGKLTTYYNTALMSFSSSDQFAISSTPEKSSKTLVPSIEDIHKKSCKRFHSKRTEDFKYDDRNRCKRSKTNIVKTVTRKKTIYNASRNQNKKVTEEFGVYRLKTRRALKEYKKLYPTASKPIPNSIIELCHPEHGSNIIPKNYSSHKDEHKLKEHHPNKLRRHKKIFSTEENVLFDITIGNVEITQDVRKSKGTDVEMNFTKHEYEEILGKTTSNLVKKDSKMQAATENGESQTIFLNDINEPSTSKGIRHVGMDVQCGTDSMPSYGVANSSVSVTAFSNAFSNGIRIDSLTNVTSKVNNVNVGTSDFNTVGCKIKSSSLFSKGIKIGDSVENVIAKKPSFDIGTVTDDRGVENDFYSPKILPKNKMKDLSAAAEEEYFYSRGNAKDRPLSPGRDNPTASTKFIHSKHAESERRSNSPTSRYNTVIKFKDSVSDLKTENAVFEEFRPTSPNPKFPDPKYFVGIQTNGSLSNLLENFDLNSTIQSKTTVSFCPSNSPDIFFKSSENKYPAKFNFVSQSNHDMSTKTEGTETLKKKSTRPLSPLLTRVKMIDLINDVSVERSAEVQCTAFAPPTPCKLIVPRTHGSESPQVVREIPLCQTSNIATSTEATANIRNKKLVTIDEPSVSIESQHDSGIESYNNIKNNFTETSSTNTNEELDSNEHLSPQKNVFGFKIKDLNDNVVKKVEVSTTHVELLSERQLCESSQSTNLSSKTKFIKSAISVSKTEDSALGVYDIPGCDSSNDVKFVKTCNNGDEHNKNLLVAQRILSCACVHVHSYKKSLEDIVYQGEWKRVQKRMEHSPNRKSSPFKNSLLRKKASPNTVIAKKSSLAVIAKRNPEATIRKLKSNLPKRTKTFDFENKVKAKVEQKKPVQVRSVPPAKVKQEVFNKNHQMRKLVHPIPIKPTKVSSKIRTNSVAARKTIDVVQFTKNKTEYSKHLELERKYLPSYLRRRKLAANICNLNSSSGSDKNRIEDKKIVSLSESKGGEIKKNLLKMRTPPRAINYMVFRNELGNSSSTTNNSQPADTTNTREMNNKTMNLQNRSSSPISQHSSTDSTADSASTVKPNVDWSKTSNRRQSAVSNKSSTGNTDSDASPSTKMKKVARRTKMKKMEAKEIENKENIPQTSKKGGLDKDFQNGKGAFLRRNKVYMAQLPEVSGCGKKQTSTKSNIKLPVIESNEGKIKPKSAAIFRQSVQSNDLLNINSQDTSNVDYVILVERKHAKDEDNAKVMETVSPHAKSAQDEDKVVDSKLLSEWLETSNVNASENESTESAILDSMRQIVEDKLSFIRSSLNEIIVDPNETNLSDSRDLDDNSSSKSFRTVVATEDTDLNDTIKSEIENVMNHSLDSVLGDEIETSTAEKKMEKHEWDFLSSTSKNSEYFMADSYRNQESINNQYTAGQNETGSVFDIFERKDIVKNPTGNRASQAFSGLSINVETMIGDQPDHVPYCYDSISEIDSMDCTRQATSEELYVSGRSTPSYESCLVEEEVHQRPDPVNLIDSETGSLAQGYHRILPIAEGNEPQDMIPLPLPMVEPVFDVNGNVMEPGIGLGAGAGDGRGIHSDHSQDSSGRGSSLSSSDASSGQQSEAILIDPSTFTTQYELFHEPVGSSMAVTTLVLPDPEHSRQGRPENETISTTRNEALRNSCATTLTSDGEADVSSTDTDIPDSS